MSVLATVMVGLVAVAHAWFLVLEMFLWTTPFGLKTFKMTAEKANATAVMAKNQGLYNGFLVAGLVWGLWTRSTSIETFFLSCVVVAGLYGAVTASRAILFVQALPGIVALALVQLAR